MMYTSKNNNTFWRIPPHLLQQFRYYRPPSNRTWSKQHQYIRYKRPLTEYTAKAAGKLQISQQWWKMKMYTPYSSFMGYPDVQEHVLRGTSLYTEKMDAVTLSMVLDKCVLDESSNTAVHAQLCRRAQQIAHTIKEPFLCYIYRSFSELNCYELYLKTTFLGRIGRRLMYFNLKDCAIIVEAMRNPKFKDSTYLKLILKYSKHLVKIRNDISIDDLLYFVGSTKHLTKSEASPSLESIANTLCKTNLQLVDISYLIEAFVVYANFNTLQINALLLSAIKHNINDVKEHKEYIKLLTGIAALHTTHKETSLINLLKNKIIEHRYLLLPQQLGDCVYALSKLNCLDGETAAELLIGVEDKIEGFSANHLCNSFNGFLKCSEDTNKILHIFMPYIKKKFSDFSGSNFVYLYEALTGPHVDISNTSVVMLLTNIISSLKSHISEFNSCDISTLLESCGYIQPNDMDVMTALFKKSNEMIEEFDVHELKRILWGLSNLEDSNFIEMNLLELLQNILNKKFIFYEINDGIEVYLNGLKCLQKCSNEYKTKNKLFIDECLMYFKQHTSKCTFEQINILKFCLQLLEIEDVELSNQLLHRQQKKRRDNK